LAETSLTCLQNPPTLGCAREHDSRLAVTIQDSRQVKTWIIFAVSRSEISQMQISTDWKRR
jgi:hypothetical protein